MSIRQATHAGSWYSADKAKLDAELTNWLGQVDYTESLPIKGCKAIIAPHAGYAYSGPAAAYAYKCIDTDSIDRVLVLGPSHHAYLPGCALSQCNEYDTPLGKLQIDLDSVSALKSTGNFSEMDLTTDEDEHSIEMHLPYIRKIFSSRLNSQNDIKIVPILVGSISTAKEKQFGEILAKFLIDPKTLFVISSDFCHWGTRFQFTYYKKSDEAAAEQLTKSSRLNFDQDFPIFESISNLDHFGMETIKFGQKSKKTAQHAHQQFSDYLKQTKNTICGRHPIGVLLGAVSALETESKAGQARLEWTRYEQSSQCETVRDSSVSYASAYLTL